MKFEWIQKTDPGVKEDKWATLLHICQERIERKRKQYVQPRFELSLIILCTDLLKQK